MTLQISTNIKFIKPDNIKFDPKPNNFLKDIVTDYDYVYRETLTCCLIKNENLRNGNLYGSTILNYVVPSAECFKLESFHDLEIANIIYKKLI